MKKIFKKLISSFDEPTINLHLKVNKIELPEMQLYGHYKEGDFDESKTISINEQWNFEGQVNEDNCLGEFEENEIDRFNSTKVFFYVERNDDDNTYNKKGLLGTGTLGINSLKESVLTLEFKLSSEIYKSMREHIFFVKDNIDLDYEDMTVRVDLINIRDSEQDYRVNFDIVRMYF